MKRGSLFGLLVAVLMVGCANPYAKYYRPFTEGLASQSEVRGVPSLANPRLMVGGNPDEDVKRMLRDGNIPIGASAFNAAEVDDNLALVQAKKVQAEVVLLYKRYTETYSGNAPVTVPTTTGSSTFLSGNVYGPGGSGSFYGNSATTTYGSRTIYVPYHIRRYDYTAIYWVRINPHAFGIMVRDLTPEEQTANGSNRGVVVSIVVRGSPAFRDDILEGDLVKGINAQEVLDNTQFLELVKALPAGEVAVSLRRNGVEILKRIHRDEGITTPNE